MTCKQKHSATEQPHFHSRAEAQTHTNERTNERSGRELGSGWMQVNLDTTWLHGTAKQQIDRKRAFSSGK
jgi:hypothetical protein